MVYEFPNKENAQYKIKEQYENFIGGEWVPPANGKYFDNESPVIGKVVSKVPRSTKEDIDKAVEAAHKAQEEWGKTSPTERSNILLRIADRIEQNLEELAVLETFENGKAVRETLNADLPLVVDHYRYFAGAIRAQEGGISQLDEDTVAYHFHEPLGVVGQIIPRCPLLHASPPV